VERSEGSFAITEAPWEEKSHQRSGCFGVCSFSGYKEGVFSPWEFSISSGIGFGLVKGAELGRGSPESFSAGEASGQILVGDSGLQRGKTKPFAFRKNKFSFVKSKPLNNLTSSWPLLIFTACVL
jgi:hypothetical protein